MTKTRVGGCFRLKHSPADNKASSCEKTSPISEISVNKVCDKSRPTVRMIYRLSSNI